MKVPFKRLLLLLTTALFCLSLASCGGAGGETLPSTPSQPSKVVETTPPSDERGSDDQTWAIYWYLCGSDLETNYGAATSDLNEMLEATLSDNVTVVVQTGGAAQWQNDVVEANAIERYVYNSEGFTCVDQQPLANMGESETLAEFLDFCSTHYPADRTMVLFWNHGGGSVSGAAFDENYGNDSLTLGEFYEAFNRVYELDIDHPPIDVVGFDTCLMATIDVAYTFCDVANYLVASEELEPGNGWYYSRWLQALSDDPAMGGAQLGRSICDAYTEGCELAGTGDEITLSVTDLSKIEPLLNAYESMGKEALTAALDDPMFFSSFGREAMRSESYGGNTDDQGYTNMVDLGHLARNSSGLLPQTTQAVLDGLEECVIYRVNGPYRSEATGLSCYYSYNGDVDDFYGYASMGYGEAFKYLYSYGIGGELGEAGMEYVKQLGYEEQALPELPTLDSLTGGEDYPLSVNDDGYAVLDVGPQVAELLTGVYFQLAYVDEAEDIILLLGRDNDIDMDWENGVFMDNFRGVWGSIDDHLVYMEIVYEGEDYNTYSVPILLNGEEYNLRVVYDYNDGQYYILGARQGLDDTGMADKNLVQLQPGDEVTTVHYAATISGDDDFEPYAIDTFTVTEDTAFYDTDMGDGLFMMMFELVDARNQTAFSEPVYFEVEDGDIYTMEVE